VTTLVRELISIGASVIVDESTKAVGSRVIQAGRLWSPYTVTIGEREMESGTVTVRRRSRPGSQETLPFSEFVNEIKTLLSVYGVSGFVRYLT
jgi:threonyl-tRNA synthetase